MRPIESLSSWRLLILVSSSENRRPAPMRQTAWSPISQIEYSVQYIPEKDLSHRASPYFHPSSGCVDEICWGLVTAHELVENLFIFLLYLWASESPTYWTLWFDISICVVGTILTDPLMATISVEYYGSHSKVSGDCVFLYILYEHYLISKMSKLLKEYHIQWWCCYEIAYRVF